MKLLFREKSKRRVRRVPNEQPSFFAAGRTPAQLSARRVRCAPANGADGAGGRTGLARRPAFGKASGINLAFGVKIPNEYFYQS